MATTCHSTTIASSRLLPALAAALIACSSSHSSGPPTGGTAPSLANLSYFPQTAGVGEGGGMVGVTFYVNVIDPDADVARLVVTVLDAADAQVSQVSGTIENPSGATYGTLGGTVDIPTTSVASYTFQVQAFDAGDRASNVLEGSFSVVPGNPLPDISMLTPASAPQGSPGLTLTLTGTGFVPESIVYWNGTSLTTTYVDATKLTASVDYSRLYYQGTAQVTVVNPPPGGGTSAAVTFVIEPPAPNPVPEIASLSPASVDAGGPEFTLTVTGSGFVPSSQVLWNAGSYDSYASTTFVDSTTLTARISTYYTSSPGTATVKVQNPTPGGGTTSALTFAITRPVPPGVRFVDLKANDVVWDPYQRKIYVAVPSLSAVNPNTVTVLDPYTGELGASAFVGSEPSRLALSDDGQRLYVALKGASSVERLTLPDLVPDLSIELGRDPTYGAYYAGDVQVAPGAPSTIAVSLVTTGSSSYSGGLVVYDDGTPRPTRAASALSSYPYDSLQWGTAASALYAVNPTYYYDLYTFQVDASGVVLQNTYRNAFSTTGGIRFDAGNGLVYGDDGRVVDPATGSLVGTYPSSSTYAYQRRVVPDSSLGSVWFASSDGYYGSNQIAISAYDLAGFHPTASTTLKYVTAPPRRPIRWGTDGLAVLNADAVVLLNGALVLPVATAPNPAPAVTSLSPSSATAGSPNLTIVVGGTDFVRGSVVLWNGAERTTRFASPTALVAYLPASDLAAAGSAEITVSSPAPGGGTSGGATFTVSP